MGIRCLNKYLNKHIISGIKHISLSNLRNKTIAIDISIYLHEFNIDNHLILNFTTMIELFKKYNIIPIFVFDGPPPKEKITCAKNMQEKSSNKIKKCDTLQVKQLLDKYDIKYIKSKGEGEKTCGKLVKNYNVDGCLTNDTDIFMYGVNKIYRNLDLKQHKVDEYTLSKILYELNITYDIFKIICIMAGTDYNKQIIHIFKGFKIYQEYKKSVIISNYKNIIKNNELNTDGIKFNIITKDFCDYLLNNKYINNIDTFIKINRLYVI